MPKIVHFRQFLSRHRPSFKVNNLIRSRSPGQVTLKFFLLAPALRLDWEWNVCRLSCETNRGMCFRSDICGVNILNIVFAIQLPFVCSAVFMLFLRYSLRVLFAGLPCYFNPKSVVHQVIKCSLSPTKSSSNPGSSNSFLNLFPTGWYQSGVNNWLHFLVWDWVMNRLRLQRNSARGSQECL